MKLGEAEIEVKNELGAIYGEGEAAALCRMLLEAQTGYPFSTLPLHRTEEVSSEVLEKLTHNLQRLKDHEPLQYVLNKAHFYGLDLYVDPSVLIPRPETEELVHWIIDDVKVVQPNLLQAEPGKADVTTVLKILDVGTGSGCIALALKQALPKAEVWGCDVSEEALNVARRNGSTLDIRVDFQGIDFRDEQQQRLLPTVDILVSNPPYIPQRESAGLDLNVVRYEPHTALFVPDDMPLLFYKKMVAFAENRLYQNGHMYLEVHDDLAKSVVDLLWENGFAGIELKQDMQGKNRMVKATKKRT